MNSTQTFSLPADMDVDSTSSIEHIERTFCTNFSCCNILLPDLHALLDHLELSTSGGHTTIPSSPVGRSPSSLSSPATSPPSTPGFHSSSTPGSPIHPLPHFLLVGPAKHQLQDDDINAGGAVGVGVHAHVQLPILSISDHYYHPDAYALAEYPTYEHCFHAAIASPPSSSSSSITDFANCAPSSSSSSPSPPPASTCSPFSSQSVKRKKGLLPPPRPTLPKKQKTSTTKRARGRPDAELAAGKTGRRSRKAYQCPTPGCTKSYLNPNGLKYHQEKGTCKIEGEGGGVSGNGKGGGRGKEKGKGWSGNRSATHAPPKFEFGFLHPHYPNATHASMEVLVCDDQQHIGEQRQHQHQHQQTQTRTQTQAQTNDPTPYIYQPQPRHWEGAGAVFGLDDGRVDGGEVEEDVYGYGCEVEGYSVSVAFV